MDYQLEAPPSVLRAKTHTRRLPNNTHRAPGLCSPSSWDSRGIGSLCLGYRPEARLLGPTPPPRASRVAPAHQRIIGAQLQPGISISVAMQRDCGGACICMHAGRRAWIAICGASLSLFFLLSLSFLYARRPLALTPRPAPQAGPAIPQHGATLLDGRRAGCVQFLPGSVLVVLWWDADKDDAQRSCTTTISLRSPTRSGTSGTRPACRALRCSSSSAATSASSATSPSPSWRSAHPTRSYVAHPPPYLPAPPRTCITLKCGPCSRCTQALLSARRGIVKC